MVGKRLVMTLLALAMLAALGLAACGGSKSTATPEGLVDTQTRPADRMVMVYVPGGEFQMGSSEAEIDAAFELCEQGRGSGECSKDWFGDESPQHTVTLDAFWIDQTEVTNAQYRQCVEAEACQAPTTGEWGEPTYEDASKADHPVVCVSWEDAQAYCAWAGALLPTEAEWEKAARGADGNIFPWGNTFDGRKLNYCDQNCEFDWKDANIDDGYARTAPVGNYPAGASPYGALDMVGNVWEWVADLYDSDYYANSPSRNPSGPDSGEYRVLRGGSWVNYALGIRSASRGRDYPGYRDVNGGFRCVVDSTSSLP